MNSAVVEAPEKRPPRPMAWALLGGLVACAVGILSVRLGDAETRWMAYGLAGVGVVSVVLLFGFEVTCTAAFIVGLSVEANYYLTKAVPMLQHGITTPGALFIPLPLLPGLALLGRRAILARAGTSDVYWVPGITSPWLVVMLSAAASLLFSSFRFAGLCVLWQGVALYLLFLVAANLVVSREAAARVLKFLMVALVGQVIVFFLQVATGTKFSAVGRVQEVVEAGGSVLHSASGTAATTTAGFAMFLDPLVMLAYAAYRGAGNVRQRRLYGTLFLVGVVVLALTLNRSTWLGVPLGIGVVELLLRRRGLTAARPGRSRLTLAPIAAAAIFALAAPMFQSVRKVDHESDLEQRFELMRPAMAMITANPVLGVGPGAYGYVLTQYAAGWRGWLYIAHNDYLLVWAERGTIGLLAWLAFLRAIAREVGTTSRRRDPWIATLGIGVMGGFVVQLWEVFWTAAMGFSSYGVMYALVGMCAGLNRWVEDGRS